MPDTWTEGRWRFRLVKRSGLIALVAKRQFKPIPWAVDTWEVVKLRVRPTHTWPNGRTTPQHEAMPCSEAWGSQGWSYQDRSDAEKRFDMLTQDAPLS